MLARIFWFAIPIPIGPLAVIVAAAWAYWSIGASIDQRHAVKRAISDLVAGSEIAALNATIEAQRRVTENLIEMRRQATKRAQDAEDALVDLNNSAEETERRLADEQERRDILLARPVASDCRVDRDLYDSLRAR